MTGLVVGGLFAVATSVFVFVVFQRTVKREQREREERERRAREEQER